MGAKAKLNSAYFHGAVVIAGVIGWVFGSWMVFLITLIAARCELRGGRDPR